MKIGVLQADDVVQDFQDEFGNYPEMFEQLLKEADPSVEIRHYNVQQFAYPASMDKCDGYVITGSKRSVYENEPFIHKLQDYVVALHEAQHKLVGICFGHQLVAQALGGVTELADAG